MRVQLWKKLGRVRRSQSGFPVSIGGWLQGLSAWAGRAVRIHPALDTKAVKQGQKCSKDRNRRDTSAPWNKLRGLGSEYHCYGGRRRLTAATQTKAGKDIWEVFSIISSCVSHRKGLGLLWEKDETVSAGPDCFQLSLRRRTNSCEK